MNSCVSQHKMVFCVCFRDGEQSTTVRTWPAHPAGLRFTCTVPCSGWIRCSPRWDPPITPYRLSPRLHCPQPCGCPHPSILVSVARIVSQIDLWFSQTDLPPIIEVFDWNTSWSGTSGAGRVGLFSTWRMSELDTFIVWERRKQSKREATGRYLIFVTNCNN